MARHPDVVPGQHDDGDQQDRGVEDLLADPRQGFADRARKGGDERRADNADRDARRDRQSDCRATPCVTANTMPTMRPASMTSRKTMISAPSILKRPSRSRPQIPITASPETLRSSIRGSRRRSDSVRAFSGRKLHGDLAASGTILFDPESLAFEFRRRLILVLTSIAGGYFGRPARQGQRDADRRCAAIPGRPSEAPSSASGSATPFSSLTIGRLSREIVCLNTRNLLRRSAIRTNSDLAQYARACGRVSVGGDLDKRPVNRPWKTGSRRRTGEPRQTGDAT